VGAHQGCAGTSKAAVPKLVAMSARSRLAVASLAFLLLASGAAAVNLVAPDRLPAGQLTGVMALDATPGRTYFARLRDSSGETAAVQSDSVLAESGFLQLDLPVGAATGPRVLELLQMPANGGEGEPEVLLSKNVEVEGAEPWLFLESDKPVYKTGSTIHVRALCLMPDLKPCADAPSIRLVLKNPDNIKVYAAQAEALGGSGVAQGSLPLDERAPLGDYVIVAEDVSNPGLQAELEVLVEEYVLPKFAVSITPVEQFLLPKSNNVLSGAISAVYSYGEQVRGSAVIRATFEKSCNFPYWFAGRDFGRRGSQGRLPHPQEECGEVVLAEKTVRDFNGSHSFELNLGETELSGYNTNVELSVAVTETATGTQINSTASVPVERNQDSQVTVSSPESFQPGLPVPVTVESRNPDGSPDDGQFLVSLTFRPSGWRLRIEETVVEEWVTTTDGVATVELLAPPVTPCCLDAVELAAESDEGLESLFGPESCCWGTVTPIVSRGDGTKKDVIRAAAEYGDCIQPAYPPAASYLSVRPKPEAAGSRQLELLFTEDIRSRDVVYMVTSANGLITSGKVDTEDFAYDAEDGYGRGTFSLPLSERLIPEAHVLVAVPAANGTLLADETKFEVDLSLLSSQPVDLEVQSIIVDDERDYVVPGERVKISGSADPGSLLFLGAVDRSVSFLSDKDTRVSASRIYSALKDQVSRDTAKPDPWGPPGPEECWHIRAFSAAGLSLDLSAASPRERRLCFIDGGFDPRYSMPSCGGYGQPTFVAFAMNAAPQMMMRSAEVSVSSNGMKGEEEDSGSKRRQQRTLRQAFPETWVWTTADVDANGNAVMFSSAPDTITTWDVSGFALSPSAGLGLPLGSAELRVFKPLFVDLKLPYKVVRGEVLEVVMTVFNYMSRPQAINLVLRGSGGAVVPLDAANQALTVAANSAGSRTAMLTFEEVGTATLELYGISTSSPQSDAVKRGLKVVPEGVADSRTLSVVLQPSEAPRAQQEVVLPAHDTSATPPVAGSLYSRLTLSGDLMGPSLEGLDSLVRLPSGCGEQNMILMAPNVYIINYLDAKRDVRSELRERALAFIQTGYSRELQYRHPDGSFSAFGEQDDSGSTWLTAFVLKVFAQAHGSGLVEVDADIASDAATWLLAHQAKNGSFASVGRVIHGDMMGGVGEDPASGEVGLTAFVATALLEARAAGLVGNLADEPLSSSLAYLQARLQQATAMSNYASVLSVHSLTLAHTQGLGDPLMAAGVTDLLRSLAVVDGEFTHWAPRAKPSDAPKVEDEGKPARRAYSVADASGPEVEMTGYALHALVLAEQGLEEGLPSVRWLLSERSDTGGWKSTQDTIVALEGLASYAAEVSADPPEMTITVVSGSGEPQELRLSADNADVVQHLDLEPGAAVSVVASGTGMAVLTLTTAWHSTAEPQAPALEIAGEALALKDGTLEAAITLRRTAGPAQSGMMVAEIGLFSGYAAEPASIEALMSACEGHVKRVETPADGRVVVYLEELPAGEACRLAVALTREVMVDNVKAAPVEAYYYYTPDRRGSALLQPPPVERR